jgi:hypothetical protein
MVLTASQVFLVIDWLLLIRPCLEVIWLWHGSMRAAVVFGPDTGVGKVMGYERVRKLCTSI